MGAFLKGVAVIWIVSVVLAVFAARQAGHGAAIQWCLDHKIERSDCAVQ